MPILPASIQRVLKQGVVLPAHPLALDARRKLDERHQRALSRYYIAAGAGGLAVGVHTTQFEIRDPVIGLFRPVLELAREEMDRADATRREPLVRIGGICGPTPQAVAEARRSSIWATTRACSAWLPCERPMTTPWCALPGGRRGDPGRGFLSATGRRRADPALSLLATVDGNPDCCGRQDCPLQSLPDPRRGRAVAELGREDVALYTGNDDKIVLDLLTPFRFQYGGQWVERRIVGGLLGHWAVWTRRAVDLLDECHRLVALAKEFPPPCSAAA